MNKKAVLLFAGVAVLLLILASCKSDEDILKEKKGCFKRCIADGDSSDFCKEDCRLEDKDMQQQQKQYVCGDGVCQEAEQQSGECQEDCSKGCSSDSDCEDKQVCEDSACINVGCVEDSHCVAGELCVNNACVAKADEDAIGEIKSGIDSLKDAIDTLLGDIESLQTNLDNADASVADKEAVQDDIDALADVTGQLKSYKASVELYEAKLVGIETSEDLAEIEEAIDSIESEINGYIAEQQGKVDAVEEAIAALEPAEKSDLIIDDVKFKEADGNEATLTVTYRNNGDADVGPDTSFRIRLTSYDDDGDEVDDTKGTISDGLDAGDDGKIDMGVQLDVDLGDYFRDNPSKEELKINFLVEIDIDVTIAEEDEDNNDEEVVITFDRDDYVSNLDPIASISANATTVAVNEIITFDGSGSSDADGSISSYSWDFDTDGTEDATGSSVTHGYSIAGTYIVTLTVTDNDGATDTATEDIFVT